MKHEQAIDLDTKSADWIARLARRPDAAAAVKHLDQMRIRRTWSAVQRAALLAESAGASRADVDAAWTAAIARGVAQC